MTQQDKLVCRPLPGHRCGVVESLVETLTVGEVSRTVDPGVHADIGSNGVRLPRWHKLARLDDDPRRWPLLPDPVAMTDIEVRLRRRRRAYEAGDRRRPGSFVGPTVESVTTTAQPLVPPGHHL